MTVNLPNLPIFPPRPIIAYTVLRKRLTLIFACEIQAGKSSFLKTTAPYKSTFSSLFYKVYRSSNNHLYLLVMPHDILLKLSYSSPSPSQSR